MYRTEDEFWDWHDHEATDSERILSENALEFENYFQDMIFKRGTATYPYSKVVNSDGSQAGDDFELDSFTMQSINYKVADDLDVEAQYDTETNTITVAKKNINDPPTILHEMIHVYEILLSELDPFYHDIVFWALYSDLKTKIPGLDRIIHDRASILHQRVIFKDGGLHDILFLLKSLDLDIRMGYTLGTVFSYGEQDTLKDVEYTA